MRRDVTHGERDAAQTMFLLRTGTISAVCGRTVALLLESRASSNPFVLLADNTAALAQYSRVNMIFMDIDTYANLPSPSPQTAVHGVC